MSLAPALTMAPDQDTMTVRQWIFQDWEVNAGRPDSRLLLTWFRLAQWAAASLGPFARVVVTPYWWLVGLVIGVEIPITAEIGPRLRLYHPHAIVLSPGCRLGADCHLRHSVTIGNRTDRSGNEL